MEKKKKLTLTKVLIAWYCSAFDPGGISMSADSQEGSSGNHASFFQ